MVHTNNKPEVETAMHAQVLKSQQSGTHMYTQVQEQKITPISHRWTDKQPQWKETCLASLFSCFVKTE